MKIDYEDYDYLFKASFTIIPQEQKLIILSLGHKLLPRVNSWGNICVFNTLTPWGD